MQEELKALYKTIKGSSIKFFIFLLINITLNASTCQSIKNHLPKGAINRINNYNKTINSYKTHPKALQLTEVNLYLNKLKYKSDKLNNHKSDYWATPKEFLTLGLGDCEDYAIIKYFTLLKLGFEKEKLFITLAYDKSSKRGHMVLSYFTKDASTPLILDNLSYKVLNLEKRKDLKISAFINTNGVYIFDNHQKLRKTRFISKKFKELLKRIEKES